MINQAIKNFLKLKGIKHYEKVIFNPSKTIKLIGLNKPIITTPTISIIYINGSIEILELTNIN